MVKSVAVYLGSSDGVDPKYNGTAREFGRRMAREGIEVVYGGACVGTMGALADGVLEEGGSICGIFPTGFGGKREMLENGRKVFREGLSKVVYVKDFAERKNLMEANSDCAVILSGGTGTMDEMFCYAVNYEIGLHEKPIWILNLDGYYDHLRALLENMKKEGFLGREYGIYHFVDTLDELVDALRNS